MSREQPLTPVERRFGERLKATGDDTCLPAQDLVELAILGSRSPNYEARMEHVVSCVACRKLLRELRAAEAERKPDGDLVKSVAIRRPLAFGALVVAVVCGLLFFSNLALRWREIVVLNDAGNRIALNAAGQLTGLPDLPLAEREWAVQALRSGRISAPPVLATLRSPAGTAATRPAFDVAAPRNTVVEVTQPEFSWKMPPGAVTCRILVTNVSNSADKIRTKPLTGDHWKPKRPLSPGSIYQWQVIALDRAGRELARVPARSDAARFKVLERDKVANLLQYRRRFGQSHLAMGVIYTQEGLLDAAEKEFQALAQENNGSDAARTLLQSLRTLKDAT